MCFRIRGEKHHDHLDPSCWVPGPVALLLLGRHLGSDAIPRSLPPFVP